MAKKYLDDIGLGTLWGKIKSALNLKSDKTSTVSTITYDSTNNKITKTINGTTTDVVTASTLKTAMGLDNAEQNQNAFSNVKVGSTTIVADAKTDTLELVAGSNVALTPDATNDKVTIAVNTSMWKDKKICVFGDSIAAGHGMTNNRSFVDILDEENVFESVHKNAVSGSTSNTLYTRLQESSSEVAEADIVYACYEGNDINGLIAGTWTTSDIVSNLRLSINYLRTLNTTCTIVWLPLTIFHTDKIGSTNATYYKSWSNAVYPIFAEFGINMLPIYDTLVLGHAQQDGRHPNEAGHQVIADLIKQNPFGYSNYPIKLIETWDGTVT